MCALKYIFGTLYDAFKYLYGAFKRMKGDEIKQEIRQAVYDKYNGHCAYCGAEIEHRKMQVDHFWPKCLAHRQACLDNNRLDNLMPSCAKCNNHKHGMYPETFRNEVSLQVKRLMKNTQFCRALRYGQVKITESPIVFYFERFSSY